MGRFAFTELIIVAFMLAVVLGVVGAVIVVSRVLGKRTPTASFLCRACNRQLPQRTPHCPACGAAL